MYKYIRLLLIGLTLSSPAWADCDGGDWITGQDGSRFCRSTAAMNWWSAMAWCQQNGMQLTTISKACSGANIQNSEDCWNMRRGSGTNRSGWTRSLCGDGSSWSVGGHGNGVIIVCAQRTRTASGLGGYSANLYALCEEISSSN